MNKQLLVDQLRHQRHLNSKYQKDFRNRKRERGLKLFSTYVNPAWVPLLKDFVDDLKTKI